MVDAVMRALPRGWKAVVVMDWSGGFWQAMHKRQRRLLVMQDSVPGTSQPIQLRSLPAGECDLDPGRAGFPF